MDGDDGQKVPSGAKKFPENHLFLSTGSSEGGHQVDKSGRWTTF